MRPPRLILVAHGSTDPRFAEVVEAVAASVRDRRPGLDVRIGYLDHGPPTVADAAEPGAVAVPLLLSAGYHVRVDLPAQAPDVVCADPVGPDPRLADALADRLREAGWDGRAPVRLAAASSGDDVAAQKAMLASRLAVDVTDDADVVATYLLAHGVFFDAIKGSVIAAPIGAHPAVTELVLARYDRALA